MESQNKEKRLKVPIASVGGGTPIIRSGSLSSVENVAIYNIKRSVFINASEKEMGYCMDARADVIKFRIKEE